MAGAMESHARACGALVLGWLSVATAAGVVPNGGLPSNVDPRDARQSKVAIFVLLCVSVLVLGFCFLFQRYTRQRDQLAAQELERLQETDAFLLKILENSSIRHLEQNKLRGITRKLQTATLQFQNIHCTVKSDAGLVTVLDDINGSFEAGHLSAIMGPSGSGKTTFIDVLTGKKRSDKKWTVRGDILINGKEQSIESLKPVIGFVPQDDVVHEGLTVRENIKFSAAKRMPAGTSEARIRKITDDVMQALQLEPKQNMIVGNRVQSGEGLSGGQKKRVNVGLELAACPTILFLDEPTSGLDATASLVLVQQLKRMAKLGMTIIMIIHQPRYSLFTLIDDVCLLGTGGKLAYIGPTIQAKPYFEKMGLQMPPNENPADWMMDILCGEVNADYSRIPKTDLPAVLFQQWKSNPNPGRTMQTLGRLASTSADDDANSIKQHLKDAWSEVCSQNATVEMEHFAKVLKACTGVTPSEEVTLEVMKRVRQVDMGRSSVAYININGGALNSSSPASLRVNQRAFIRYMITFGGLNPAAYASPNADNSRLLAGSGAVDEESSSSDDDQQQEEETSEDDGVQVSLRGICSLESRKGTANLDDLVRKQAGFCTHLSCTLRQSMLSFWRSMDMKTLFLLVMTFAACFLAFFDRFIFKSPPWMPTTFLNAQIALALLVSVYSLQLFSNDQAMYWREASHGLNRSAFLVGRALVNTLDWLLLTFFFVLVYYVITQPILTFLIYIVPFILVAYVASGWGYAISCCLPVSMGAFISAILAFMMGGILGLPMQMSVFLKGGLMEVIVDSISFTRWSAAMSFLAYIRLYPPDPQFLNDTDKWQLEMFSESYSKARYLLDVHDDSWWTGIMVLLIQGTVLRVVAYLGLRFTNRARQV
ncbi:unnamed protein product [Durusdinium trenchii]|uniref:ABC transporter domain-containing protein n=1 Tax=Durusdinium trenchii TaxID=1381693 RepID=A0ABP0SLA6_9DINO